ncbi:hypothetical protein Tco_0492128 [Tanacetum coccineum]
MDKSQETGHGLGTSLVLGFRIGLPYVAKNFPEKVRNKSSATPQARKDLLEYVGKRKQIGEMVKNHTSDKDSDPECRTCTWIFTIPRQLADIRGLSEETSCFDVSSEYKKKLFYR